MQDNQRDSLERLAWRLMNNAVFFQQEPESYVPIRLLDGVIGILEILEQEDEKYLLLRNRVESAKENAVDNPEQMVEMLKQLILEHIRSCREREARESR